MGVFKKSKGSLYTLNVLIIKLVVWLGWLSSVALGQLELSETITGFVNFPEVGISCIGNLAVFITSVSKGRLDLEMGVRDVFATWRGPKVENIHRLGLTTCKKDISGKYEVKDGSVVMLSYNTPDSSIKQFMKYIANAHNVQSVLLECWPLKSFAICPEICSVNEACNCNDTCKCVVFLNVKGIKERLDDRMPGTLKELPNSYCLLLSAGCLRKGCHQLREGDSEDGKNLMTEGSSEGAHKSGGDRLTEPNSKVEFPPPVCEILEDDYVQKEHTCICIPVSEAAKDDWTKLLITSFRTKDNEERKVSVKASDAMENYTAQEAKDTYMAQIRRREQLRKRLIVEFSTPSLILPRLTEILINLLLIGWFRVDGFSTSMVARKAVKRYVVGSKESGFAANVFLTKALVKSKNTTSDDVKPTDNDTHVCQVLTFRGPLLGLRTLSSIAGGFNVLCSLFWIAFVAYEGRGFKWYDIHSMQPSIPRVAVIIAAISIALGMDFLHLYLNRPRPEEQKGQSVQAGQRKRPVVMGLIVLEIIYIVLMVLEIVSVASRSPVAKAVAGALRRKDCRKWVYSAVQALVWVKWGIGSYLIGELHSESKSEYNWKSGILVYSSSFFLNFMLAGVRCKWRYSPS